MPYIDELFNMGDEIECVISTEPPKTILAKFFNEFETAKIHEVAVGSSNPEAHVKSSDVEGLPGDVVISIEGTEYLINAFQPDGTGLTVLKLTLNQ